MADADIDFDFESGSRPVNQLTAAPQHFEPPDLPADVIGQQPGNFKKNYRKTVCTYWIRGLCMKGDQCGFLHQFDAVKMPVCRTFLKTGECKDPDCPYKHSLEEIKECNMYKLGFCIYGPQCRYKHIKMSGPPPEPDTVEACKPKDHRNINLVVNQVNPGVVQQDEKVLRGGGGRGRYGGRFGDYGGRGRGNYMHLPASDGPQGHEQGKPLALPAPGAPFQQDWQHNLQRDMQAGSGMPPLLGPMPPMMPGMMPGIISPAMPGLLPGMMPGMPFDPAMFAAMNQGFQFQPY